MKSLGIRSEDKNRWEKRVPLVPSHISELLGSHTFPIYVESPSIRIFPARDYEVVGCSVTADINQADIIIGVKEIPENKIAPNKVYLFFSHTIKGQKPNMPLLQTILDSGSTLIDYERIVDESNRRLLYFGNYAGTAGAIDILMLIGQEWQRMGITSPLLKVKQAFDYPTVASARHEISAIAREVENTQWPAVFNPFVFGIFGYGNVSRGAQDILTLFPHEYLEPEQLLPLRTSGSWKSNTIYICVFKEEDMVRHNQGKQFDLQHYYTDPKEFEPVTERYIPELNVLVNAVFWNKQYPRFLTRRNAPDIWHKIREPRFFAIADLSCDVEGGIEITVKTTDSGHPSFKYNPSSQRAEDDLSSDGYLVLAVDNLPGELAYDASAYFSNLLKEFIPSLVKADYDKSLPESGLDPALQRAVIVYNGELTPDYRYLQKFLA